MQSVLRHILTVLLVACCFILPVSAQPSIGGDNSWYAVNCNIDGAQVYFDNEYQGEIQGGVLYVPVYTTGSPYSTFRVEKDGYVAYYGDINSVPGKDETIFLYATLNPVKTPAPIGGDVGWYTVHANVDGATVMFDNEVKGTISQGVLSVQVYTTGTPYQTYTLTKDGYTAYTGSIDRYPGKGETVDLYATMNPAPTPAPTQESPLSPVLAGGALLIVGLLLVTGRKN
jgi:hypothetical protein